MKTGGREWKPRKRKRKSGTVVLWIAIPGLCRDYIHHVYRVWIGWKTRSDNSDIVKEFMQGSRRRRNRCTVEHWDGADFSHRHRSGPVRSSEGRGRSDSPLSRLLVLFFLQFLSLISYVQFDTWHLTSPGNDPLLLFLHEYSMVLSEFPLPLVSARSLSSIYRSVADGASLQFCFLNSGIIIIAD